MNAAYKLLIFLFFVFVNQVSALEFHYNLFNYPTESEISNYLKNDPVNLEVCCRYPTKSEVMILNSLKLSSLKIKAGFFPSKVEMSALNNYKGEYSIELSEVFPSDEDYTRLNNSTVSQLIINSRDFLTMGEATAFNGFDLNLRININHREYPLPRHMKVLKVLKSNFIVAFKNQVLPGVGYANFFNALKTKKVFTSIEKFPYGDDYRGVNALTNSSVEILSNEYLFYQDVDQINKMKISKIVYLDDQSPYTGSTIDLIKKIEAEKVYITGFDDTLNSSVDIFRTAKSNIILVK
tara:strand:- start:19314 stop:20195 length:882 start_codon:yes stop_codon:yes gene_type:complete